MKVAGTGSYRHLQHIKFGKSLKSKIDIVNNYMKISKKKCAVKKKISRSSSLSSLTQTKTTIEGVSVLPSTRSRSISPIPTSTSLVKKRKKINKQQVNFDVV